MDWSYLPPSVKTNAVFFRGLFILTSIIKKFCCHGNDILITFNPLIAN